MERSWENMRKKRSVMAAVAGMMAVMAMMLGITMPSVHAESKVCRVADVVAGTITTVSKDDQLVWPEDLLSTPGMVICYRDTEGNELTSVSTQDTLDYKIPAYEDLGLAVRLPGGNEAACWRITKWPTSETDRTWDLTLCTEESNYVGKRSIDSVNTYVLQKNVTYTLEGNVCHVQGDATVYADSIDFTVDKGGRYNFFK